VLHERSAVIRQAAIEAPHLEGRCAAAPGALAVGAAQPQLPRILARALAVEGVHQETGAVRATPECAGARGGVTSHVGPR
jgi:hypothetical protein